MHPNYNVPNYMVNMPRNRFGFNRNRNDRFFGGGFVAPFLLGGITGSLLSRPNNFYGGYPRPYFVPVPFFYNTGYPTYSQNYYYY